MICAFDNSYQRLPARFFREVKPTPVRAPRVRKLNGALVETLGLTGVLGLDRAALEGDKGAAIFAGNTVPEGAASIALAYAGHQFGRFVPQLGDGRAILMGEVVGRDGARRDLQWKGAGPTPFSRNGDGRAALGPALREYVVSEAMHALGIPSTRALALVTTGERVFRDEPLPGAVIVRVAASHLRVGTFEYFANKRDTDALDILTRYALERHFPAALDATADSPELARALLDAVIDAQANLIAKWLGVGFIHGVMNTDNTTISGETLDYGPCAFLDAYDPDKRFSSIDHQGRYAFSRQPQIALWNMARLAETLIPLLADEQERGIQIATDSLERYGSLFETAQARVVRAKLGLPPIEGPFGPAHEPDANLAVDLYGRLETDEVDHTNFFRALASSAEAPEHDRVTAALFRDPGAFHSWAETWRGRFVNDARSPADRALAMRGANPAFIPRNHRIEQAIQAAIQGDFEPFEALLAVLSRPFDDQPEHAEFTSPPKPDERVEATFCGT